MKAFVPLEKASKKQQRALALKKRVLWDVKPVSQRIESKKRYDRKWKSRREDHPDGFSVAA